MSEAFRLDLDLFEGPLDLLLYLIRKEDVDVRRLRVADVAEQYIRFIETMQQINLDVASEYLVMAATLTWMKSRMLLPRVEEDDEEVEDLRAELIEKLLEYEQFKQAAEWLDDRPLLGRDYFPARADASTEEAPDRELEPVSVFALVEAFARILDRLPEGGREPVMRLVLPQRSLEDGAVSLRSRFRTRSRLLLRELIEDTADRNDLIVRFLALLELIRVGELCAVRELDDEEIHIARRRPDQPLPDYASMVKGAYGPAEDDSDR